MSSWCQDATSGWPEWAFAEQWSLTGTSARVWDEPVKRVTFEIPSEIQLNMISNTANGSVCIIQCFSVWWIRLLFFSFLWLFLHLDTNMCSVFQTIQSIWRGFPLFIFYMIWCFSSYVDITLLNFQHIKKILYLDFRPFIHHPDEPPRKRRRAP